MDLAQFFIQFQDFLAPKLGVYEQAIYLFIFRQSRLIGKNETVIGFKSARTRMATGIGEKGKPMAERTAYEALRSLEVKGCLKILGTERMGKRIQIYLPDEILGLVVIPREAVEQSIEEMDFFEVPENRARILARESHKCFYCSRNLTENNYVIEHVVSRPLGSNGYRNVVGACLQCNNRKNDIPAEDFLRMLYREELLNAEELKNRIEALKRLKDGDLKP